MTWINFEKLYKDEPSNYHLMSSCFFIKDKYIKTTYGKIRDDSTKKQKMIIDCIEQHAKNYNTGKWSNNVRLRIYFDNSLEKHSLWNIIKEKYLYHPFFQWVKYKIPHKTDPKNPDIYIGLIGTIVRFHPLFVKNNKVNVVSIVDLDNMYSEEWKKEIDRFVSSSYDIQCLSSLLNIPFYGSIIGGISDDLPCGYWIPAGLFSSKITFPYSRWTNMMNYIYSSNILYKLRFFDSFKMSIFNNETDHFFEDFEYGLDEILINQIINYYVKSNKIKIQVFHIKNRVDLSFFRKRIIDYLDWNNRKTDQIYYLFKIYKVRSFSELKNVLFRPKTIEEFFKLLRKPETIQVLNQLQFDKRLICLIKDYNQKSVDSYPLLSNYLL